MKKTQPVELQVLKSTNVMLETTHLESSFLGSPHSRDSVDDLNSWSPRTVIRNSPTALQMAPNTNMKIVDAKTIANIKHLKKLQIQKQ